MARYSDLPTEIRQWILCLSMPKLNDAAQPWLHEVRCLMLINKESFDDMRKILHLLEWSLVYTIRKDIPPALPTESFRNELSILPPPTTVCLCLFYDVDPHRMRANPDVIPCNYYPQMRQWAEKLSVLLTKETRTVLIDATPAPWYVRRKPPSYTATLVNDTRTKKWFLDYHHTAVTALVKRIAVACGNKTDLVLVGTYGMRSRHWVDGIVQDCARDGVRIGVRVDYVQHTPVGRSLLWRAIRMMPPIADTYTASWLWAVNAEQRMQDTNWRGSTCELYEQCSETNEEWALYVLSHVRSFIADETLRTLDLTPSNARERKLAHHLIEDVGLWSESVGEEPSRFVRFSRDRIQRPWERHIEISDNV